MRIRDTVRFDGQPTVNVCPGCCALPDVYRVLRLPSSAFGGVSVDELSLAVAVQSLRSNWSSDGCAGGGGGGGGAPALWTATRSNTPVTHTPRCAPCTTAPMYAVLLIVTEAVPTGVHVAPSAERNPEKVLPARVSFSQLGSGRGALAT